MAYQDPLQGEISELIKKFVKPKIVVPVFQLKNMLTEEEIDQVEAKTEKEGHSGGVGLLLGLLVGKTGWFDNLQIVLRDKNVKLEHIADIIVKERNRIEQQSAGHRTNGYTRAEYSDMPTLSTLYIEYNKKLEDGIRALFVAKIGDPGTAVNVLRKYSDKVLTPIDCDNVKAKVRCLGAIEGAILLFNRLVLYDSWPDVLKQFFNDAEIGLPDVAAEVELHINRIKDEYEQKKSQIEHLYQTNEPLQHADNRMDTDDPCSGTATRARPSSQDEFETVSAEMRPAAKGQARSCKNKENTVSDCGSEDSQNLASQGGSSENRDATAGKTELMSAAAAGKLGSLLYLIENGADLDESDSQGRTALMYAVPKCHFKCVQQLVSRGCDVNKKEIHGLTALMLAAGKGFSACVECLLENNADVDNTDEIGSTALMVAAREGFVDCMRLLIKNGCQVDKCHGSGQTALMYAAFYGHSECVNLLICSGCNVNQSGKKGTTALMIAAKSGQVECIRLLLNGLADLDIADEEGNTALIYAVLYNQIECLKVLIDSKANITIANRHGYTPLAAAVKTNHKRCMNILRAAFNIR